MVLETHVSAPKAPSPVGLMAYVRWFTVDSSRPRVCLGAFPETL